MDHATRTRTLHTQTGIISRTETVDADDLSLDESRWIMFIRARLNTNVAETVCLIAADSVLSIVKINPGV
jgi:hypothetical protein